MILAPKAVIDIDRDSDPRSSQVHKARIACAANVPMIVMDRDGGTLPSPYPMSEAAWEYVTEAHRIAKGLATDAGDDAFERLAASLDADLLRSMAEKYGIVDDMPEGMLVELAEAVVGGEVESPLDCLAIGYMLRWHLPECDPRQPYPSVTYIKERRAASKDIYQGDVSHAEFWGDVRTPPADVIED